MLLWRRLSNQARKILHCMRKMTRRGLRRIGSRLSRTDVLPLGAYRLAGRNDQHFSHPDGLLSELVQLVILPTYRCYFGFRFVDWRLCFH